MQGVDFPAIVSLAAAIDPVTELRGRDPGHPVRTDEDRPLSSWTLATPPLRYDVASMEHWLDLNA
jgi:hypothetical protein